MSRDLATAGAEADAGWCVRAAETVRQLNLFVRPEAGDGRLGLLRFEGNETASIAMTATVQIDSR